MPLWEDKGMSIIIRIVVAGAASSSLIATPVLAESASQLGTLNGLQADGAESALRSRGFDHVSSHQNSQGYTYSYWWDREDRSCVSVETYNRSGRVETITDSPASDCGHTANGSGGGAGAALGVALGAALLGAAVASKSHHRDGAQYSAEDQRRFDNGYTDGLHNAPYHNKHDSDAYARGYEAGVDERSANLSHHSGRGGYTQMTEFADLQDARAAGGMDELQRRGFRQVDNFTSGNTRYSIQWQPATRQCVQVTIADGRFYDLRDIGQNPNCR
jgi:hypothetical protein